MTKLNQALLDRIVQKAAAKPHVQGAVFHLQSVDRSLNLASAHGNLNTNSQYFIASINKIMLSALALQLCEQQKLRLSDKVAAFFPQGMLRGACNYKGTDYSEEITIRHLLSHTTGFRCYLIDKGPDGQKNMQRILNGEDQAWPLDKMVSVLKQQELKFAPGAKGKANYSEVNFRLLGAVLAQATQRKTGELLQDMFTGLNMNHTFVLPSEQVQGCTPMYFKLNPIWLTQYWTVSCQDVVSNVFDQMTFIRAFFEGHFFPVQQLPALKQWNNIFFPFQYGIGVQKFYIPRILSPFKPVPEILGHCGSVGSVAFFVPEKQVYITGTVNQTASPATAFQAMMRIINAL